MKLKESEICPFKGGGQHDRTQLLPMRQELLFNVVRYVIIKRRGVGSVKLPQRKC